MLSFFVLFSILCSYFSVIYIQMTWYLLKLLAVLWVSNFVIYLYYFVAQWHRNTYEWFFPFILWVLLLYFCYRMFIAFLTRNPKIITIKLTTLFWLFLSLLFVLCCFFFYFSWESFYNGLTLFWLIAIYSILPIWTMLLLYWFGDVLLWKLKWHRNQSEIFQYLSGFGLWFFLFTTFLVLVWMFWFYNIYFVAISFVVMAWFWLWSLLKLFSFLWKYEFIFENDPKKPSFIYFTSSEFLFFILSLLISVNLISIVRPVPIWWDDLWVYMNYPHLMAQAKDILSFGGMYAWQVFTGIGFMTGSNTQAFFFNSIWGMMSFLVIFLILKDLFSHSKKTFLNIPLLLVTCFASMPMITFQLAKDMKLDPGLLSMSAIALYIIYYCFLKIWWEKKYEWQKNRYIFLASILLGFAFTIKFTSLLLVSGILGLIFYRFLWMKWFLWYMAIYIAVFTKLWLWSYMNISYPSEDLTFVNNVSVLFWSAWIFIIGSSVLSKWKKIFQSLFKYLCIIALWFILAIFPWLWKNIFESSESINISTLLWWRSDSLIVDYEKIHSKEKIEAIKKESMRKLSASGTTQNEDWGRYFWYEKGINNYLKLPLNLTVQKNQAWEFTDIWFLYLAFLPIIFLFLPYRRKEFVYVTLWVCSIWFLAFFYPLTASYMTTFMSLISLPLWYIIIWMVFLLWLILISILDSQKKHMKLFEYNLIFTLFYTFLWTISAYWVVWYWIVMYLNFLIMIGISLYYISSYNESDTEKKLQTKLFWSGIIFVIFSFSFLMSTIPQALKNLKTAWYVSYKVHALSANEALFWSQNGYLEAIYSTNINPEAQKIFLEDAIENKQIRDIMISDKRLSILQIVNTLKRIQNDPQVDSQTIQLAAKSSLENIYKKILHPKETYKNTKNIYRVGTFLSYYITENNSRLLNDSLLFRFNDYIYSDNVTKTLENIKNLWLEYMLVDLNAATIDKDSRRNLTQRYEKLLNIFPADDIQLLATDSICLKLWLNKYANSAKDQQARDEFMILWGVNYESFREWGKVVLRTQKLQYCYQKIDELIAQDSQKLYEQGYWFLLPLKNYLASENWASFRTDQSSRFKYFSMYVPSWRFALFKINSQIWK